MEVPGLELALGYGVSSSQAVTELAVPYYQLKTEALFKLLSYPSQCLKLHPVQTHHNKLVQDDFIVKKKIVNTHVVWS